MSSIYGNDYAIDCDVTLGNSWNREKDSEYPNDTPRLEITSGGPGSTGHNCCGSTVAVDLADGIDRIETEDWSKSGPSHTGG